MNAKDFDKIVGNRMNWCEKTLCAKGDEYARGGDRLWNFKVAARKLNCHPAEALAGMMVKHAVSVDDIIDGLAKGIVPPKELVAEKIGDSINYLLLLEGLVEEERQRREEVPEMNAALKEPKMEVYGGHVVCSGCGLVCSIGSEQEQSVNLTGRCTLCRAEKERETYTVPPLQDGDDDPAVAQVATSARTKDTARDAMATSEQRREAIDALTSAFREALRSRGDDEWRPCPEGAL